MVRKQSNPAFAQKNFAKNENWAILDGLAVYNDTQKCTMHNGQHTTTLRRRALSLATLDWYLSFSHKGPWDLPQHEDTQRSVAGVSSAPPCRRAFSDGE